SSDLLPSLTVTPPPVATVTVVPAVTALASGLGMPMIVTLTAASGQVLTGRVITWSSSDSSVMTVDNQSFAAAFHVGAATLTATSEGKSGSTVVTVFASPAASLVTVTRPSVPAGDTVTVMLTAKEFGGGAVSSGGVVV